ncbi:MAG: hypothetical protein IPN69_07475 [Acidobacteria bacterium]|nr:hypothetical protein [Acidobacteriota bacterium]
MTQRITTFDCETIPAADAESPFWSNEEERSKTSLDGNFGRLLCIGYVTEFSDGRPLGYGCFGWNEEEGILAADERSTLSGFWQMLADFDVSRDLLVGHNIFEFDLPFIVKRSIVNGVRPTVNFNLARYRNRPIYDTMRVWDCWASRGWTSLGKLAFALGLPSPKDGDVGGSNIFENWQAGRHREIYEYCMRDVKTTRNVFRKMNFTFPEALPASA